MIVKYRRKRIYEYKREEIKNNIKEGKEMETESIQKNGLFIKEKMKLEKVW